MVRKPRHSQLVKYDVDQKILHELSNPASRVILFSIEKRAKHIEEIFKETNLPLSTLYLKLINLQNLSLIFVERMELSDNGHRLKYFRSRISEAEISIEKLKPKIVLVPNKHL